MIVAITGGSGFIGQRLVECCIRRGYQVRCLTRKTTLTNLCVEYFVGDLTDPNVELSGFVNNIDVLYHCAGEIHNDDLMMALHVNGTERLIDAINKEVACSGKSIHWIQLSSVGAYGPPLQAAGEERIVTETSALNPNGLYEETKLQSDELVVKASQNCNYTYTIVRPSIVFGKAMPNQSLRQLVTMVKKGMFFYVGKENAIAPYVHIDDVVDLLICCSENAHAKNEVFNISNDCMLRDLINAIADYSSVRRPFIRLPEKIVRIIINILNKFANTPLTQNRIDALVSRTRYPAVKIEKHLGFLPKRKPQESIREIL